MFETNLLSWVIFLPLIGVGVLLVLPRVRDDVVRAIALVTTVVNFLVSLLLATTLLGRRQQRHEMREIVSVLEELRSGHSQGRVQIDPRSPTALVADAVNRLAQDLAGRWGRSEHATRQLEALLEVLADHAVIEADADWDVRRCTAGTEGA